VGTLSVSASATGYQTNSRSVQVSGESASVEIVLLSASTPTYEIKGVVTGFGGGPVGNATVMIADPAPNPNAGRSVHTDSAGAYSLTGLAYGGVTLSVSATSYQTSTRAVQMVSGVTSMAVDLSLTPSVATYTVKGTVTRRTGGPLPGAAVYVLITGQGSAVADANGNFTISGINYVPSLPMMAIASGYDKDQHSIPLVFGTEVATANFSLTPLDGITFAGLGTGPFSSWTEKQFTVTNTLGPWRANPYGNPAPAVVFDAPAGGHVQATLAVTGDGRPFRFESIDLYSSATGVPYTITGTRNGAVVLQMSGQGGAANGAFGTVLSTNSGALIDALTITLTNVPFPCCSNPMGLDNIRVFY